jgi:hypothetical protein
MHVAVAHQVETVSTPSLATALASISHIGKLHILVSSVL